MGPQQGADIKHKDPARASTYRFSIMGKSGDDQISLQNFFGRVTDAVVRGGRGKELFESEVRGPMVELVTLINEDLKRFALDNAAATPARTIYRIYRDTRVYFSSVSDRFFRYCSTAGGALASAAALARFSAVFARALAS